MNLRLRQSRVRGPLAETVTKIMQAKIGQPNLSSCSLEMFSQPLVLHGGGNRPLDPRPQIGVHLYRGLTAVRLGAGDGDAGGRLFRWGC